MPDMHDMSDPFRALCRHCDVHRPPTSSGALDGLTFVVKDNIAVAGHRNCAGSPDWLRTHEAASANAPVVDMILAAGAELVGMATLDELAYSVAGRNAHFGAPINPAYPDGITGGSSSGSAAAVAGGLVDFAIGTDTTGSVRTPAALCGLFGIRPTHGAIDLAGVVPLAPSFDTIGAFARSPEVLERVMGVMGMTSMTSSTSSTSSMIGAHSGAQHPIQLRRALIAHDALDLCDAAVRIALMPAVADMCDLLGVRTDVVALGDSSLADWAEAVRIVQAREAWGAHGAWIRAARPRFGPGVVDRFAAAEKVTAAEHASAASARTMAAQRVLDLVGDDSIVVLPTSPSVAPPRDAPEPRLADWRRALMALTSMANVSGCPQVTVPVARVDGAPVGLSLLGPRGSDGALIALARRSACRWG